MLYYILENAASIIAAKGSRANSNKVTVVQTRIFVTSRE